MKLLVPALAVAISNSLFSQTMPAPQTLPYNQDFSALLHTSAAYPAGWQGWELSATAPSTVILTNAPLSDISLGASKTAADAQGGVANYDGKIGMLSRAQTNNNTNPSLALAISTIGQTGIKIMFDAMTIRNPYGTGQNSRINSMVLQYRIGTSGAFTTLSGTSYSNGTTAQTSGTSPQNPQTITVVLPASCENVTDLQLRWVMHDVSGSGTRPSFAVDNISICGIPTISAGGPTTVCTGDSVTLTASAGSTFLWSTGETTQSITKTASGSYNVTVTQMLGCNNTSASTVITLLPLPTVSINASQTQSLCPGSSIDLAASGASNYVWTGGVLTSSVSVSPTSTTAYDVIGTDDNGCSSTASQSISVQNFKCSVAPAYSNYTIKNLNSNIQISNLSGATAVKYTFTPSSGGTAVTKTVSPYSTALNLRYVQGLNYNEDYTVTVQPYQGVIPGCVSNTSSLHILQPAVNLTIGCNGNFSTLNTNIQCGICPGATSVTWTFIPVSGGATITKTITPFTNNLNLSTVSGLQYGTSYNVQVRADANGITGITSQPCIINILQPAPYMTIGCNATYNTLNKYLQCSTMPGATSVTWQFTPNDGTAPVTVTKTPFVNNLYIGNIGLQYGKTYNVTLQATSVTGTGPVSNGCPLTIGAPSVAVYTGCGATYTSLYKTIQNTGCAGASSIEWLFTPLSGGAAISKTIAPFSTGLVLSTVPGLTMGETYTVQVRATANGLTGPYSSSSCEITLGSSSAKLASDNSVPDKGNTTEESSLIAGIEQQGSEQLKLFPNPNAGNFVIELQENAQVNIFNSLGELVLSQEMYSGTTQVDLSNFGKGIYFLVMTPEQGKSIRTKVVVQ